DRSAGLRRHARQGLSGALSAARVGAPIQYRARLRTPRRRRAAPDHGRRHGARDRTVRSPAPGSENAKRRPRRSLSMTFEWPAALLLLIVVPVLAFAYIAMQRRRNQYALRYASVSLVAQAVGSGPGIKRHVPAGLYLLAIAALIIGLARPQATIPVPLDTGTVVLVIDVSGSMFAQDVDPNRMEATKQAARDFVENQPDGVKVGVVSFSDFAALVAPPATERRQALEAISRLRPQRGTNIGAGLQVALDAIYEDQADGEAVITSEPSPTPAYEMLDVPPASIVLV